MILQFIHRQDVNLEQRGSVRCSKNSIVVRLISCCRRNNGEFWGAAMVGLLIESKHTKFIVSAFFLLISLPNCPVGAKVKTATCEEQHLFRLGNSANNSVC
ncbi:MAG: hypothetical protein MJZ98_03050 [Paludibacteraceae bacterium]|nr:hypothetical protein [Paludibacteraceae bacterium]